MLRYPTILRAIKQLLYTGMLLASLAACNTQQERILTVEGEVKNAAGKKLMLAELPYASSNRIVIDSVTLDSSGMFRLQSVQSQENMYQLFVVNGPGILLINDADQITVQLNASDPGNYQTSGSPASASIKALYEQFTPLYQRAQQAQEKAQAAEQDRSLGDSLRSVTLQARDAAQSALRQHFLQYLQTEQNPTALYFALGMARQFVTPAYWNAQVQETARRYPVHPGLALLKVRAATASEQGSHLLNKPVPELVLPDTSGKPFALSSLRGRWVLVDCWASWCQPCRQENPNIVKAWRQYNKRNFTILGVSLDKDRNNWRNAIATDSLTWQHVSDLKFWDSQAATTFDIQSLPFNMLVDPKGIVRAINLRDSLLPATLQQMLR